MTSTSSATCVYERNATDVKDEFMLRLINLIKNPIYDGIEKMHGKAIKMYAESYKLYEMKNLPEDKKPSLTILFQNLLSRVPEWNNEIIEHNTNDIRKLCDHAEYFDKLIKATVKANITALTMGTTSSGITGKPRVSTKDHHTKVNSNNFIHLCYIASSKRFRDNPYLFNQSKKMSELQIKMNKWDAIKLIEDGIKEAVWKSSPIEEILDEYLDLIPISYLFNETKVSSSLQQSQVIQPLQQPILPPQPAQPQIIQPTQQPILPPQPQVIQPPQQLLKNEYGRPKVTLKLDNVIKDGAVPHSIAASKGGGDMGTKLKSFHSKRNHVNKEEDLDENINDAIIKKITGHESERKTTEKSVIKGGEREPDSPEYEELENYSNSAAYKKDK